MIALALLFGVLAGVAGCITAAVGYTFSGSTVEPLHIIIVVLLLVAAGVCGGLA